VDHFGAAANPFENNIVFEGDPLVSKIAKIS
jgi:hypothetical protein